MKMKLYRIDTDWRDSTFYVFAAHATAAAERLTKTFTDEGYSNPPVALSIHLIAEAGITGTPAVLIV